MSQMIAVKIPDLIAEKYATPGELEHNILEAMLIREFQKGHLSLRESAGLLNVSYEGFMEWLAEREIPFVNATEAELEQSYQTFEQFMEDYVKP